MRWCSLRIREYLNNNVKYSKLRTVEFIEKLDSSSAKQEQALLDRVYFLLCENIRYFAFSPTMTRLSDSCIFVYVSLFFAFAMTTMLGYYFRAYRRRYWRTNYIYGTAARRARTNTDNGTHPQQAVSDTAQGVYWWSCCTMEVHVVESFEFAVNFANEFGKTPGSSTSTFIADLTLDSMTKGIDYIKVILQPHFNFSWHDTRWWNG